MAVPVYIARLQKIVHLCSVYGDRPSISIQHITLDHHEPAVWYRYSADNQTSRSAAPMPMPKCLSKGELAEASSVLVRSRSMPSPGRSWGVCTS